MIRDRARFINENKRRIPLYQETLIPGGSGRDCWLELRQILSDWDWAAL
jgi:hypothetical protein